MPKGYKARYKINGKVQTVSIVVDKPIDERLAKKMLDRKAQQLDTQKNVPNIPEQTYRDISVFHPISRLRQRLYDKYEATGYKLPEASHIPKPGVMGTYKSGEYDSRGLPIHTGPATNQLEPTEWGQHASRQVPLANAQYSVLDVGQGSSAFIQTPGGPNMLIDTGLPKMADNEKAPPLDVILAAMKREGVDKLDNLMITHGDNDHDGNAGELVKRFPDVKLWLNGLPLSKAVAAQLKRIYADRPGAYPMPSQIGDVIPLGANGKIRILNSAPATEFLKYLKPKTIDNDTSMSTEYSYGENRVVNGADVQGKWGLMNTIRNASPNVDVYVASHHGSDNGSSAALLNKLRPKSIAISVGRDNKYGLPGEQILAYAGRNEIPVYRTDEDGTIVYKLPGRGNVTVKTRGK